MNYASDEWIDYAWALEAERVDVTHTVKPLTEQELNFAKFARGKRELKAKIEQLNLLREQRDKLFYNAGRYAGGARDSFAVSANSVVDALMGCED